MLSVLIFSCCTQAQYPKQEKIVGKVISLVARLSLGAYLFSQLFDHWFYSILNSLVPQVRDRLVWFPVAVTAVLSLSVASSHVLNTVYEDTVAKLVDRVKEKLTV